MNVSLSASIEVTAEPRYQVKAYCVGFAKDIARIPASTIENVAWGRLAFEVGRDAAAELAPYVDARGYLLLAPVDDHEYALQLTSVVEALTFEV